MTPMGKRRLQLANSTLGSNVVPKHGAQSHSEVQHGQALVSTAPDACVESPHDDTLRSSRPPFAGSVLSQPLRLERMGVLNMLVGLLTVLYTIGAVGMALYGAHAAWLALLHWKQHRRAGRTPDAVAAPLPAADWPYVTVQLPIYNERHVVSRLLEAAAALDYPRNRLEIQLLDDSTDDTGAIADATIEWLQHEGADVKVVRRNGRAGNKAGALAHALPAARGEFIAIFDADFLPSPEFLKQVVAPFLAPGRERLAFVQGRWAHLNRNYSLLTRCQALALDGHFGVEQSARAADGLPFGFNGSAGIWRRAAIEDPAVGGWQPDTLCEDLDLAYRAQLAGWQAAYLPDAAAPAEVPPQLLAFKRQQARWATGSVQTLVKLGGRVAHSGWTWRSRIAGLFHLGNYLIHPLLLVLLLASVPLTLLGAAPPTLLGALSLASLGPPLLYALAEQRLYPTNWFRNFAVLPILMLFGMGLSWSNSNAVWRGLREQGGDFPRTPKFRIESTTDRWQASGYRLPVTRQMIVEGALMLYATVGVVAGLRTGAWWAALFLGLFALGFGAMVGVEAAQALPRAVRSAAARGVPRARRHWPMRRAANRAWTPVRRSRQTCAARHARLQTGRQARAGRPSPENPAKVGAGAVSG